MTDVASLLKDRLREARKLAGFSQEVLAKKAGVSQGTIGNLESGERKVPRELLAISKALNVRPEWLKMGELPIFPETDPTPSPHANVVVSAIGDKLIPVIDYVQAGAWRVIADNFIPDETTTWLRSDSKLSGRAFALEIEGSSMKPKFNPGDKVIIDPDVSPRPGDYVVAKNGEAQATFKKYRLRGINAQGNEVFELVPLNSDFESLRSDEQPINIVGVMMEHRTFRPKE